MATFAVPFPRAAIEEPHEGVNAWHMSKMGSDVVGVWEVPLNDKVHRIEFEHGTTTGRRVVRLDGKEIVRRDWMFKLVGNENFEIPGHIKCQIQIRASNGFAYVYTLFVNGKLWKRFKESQEKATKTWIVTRPSGKCRIVLEKDSLDVWVDGRKVVTEGVFGEDGTEIQFPISTTTNEETVPDIAHIRTISSGNVREGIVYCLIMDGQEMPEAFNSI